MRVRAAHFGACVFLLYLLGVAPAGAAELDGGCEGSGTSLDADGAPLDEASAPGAGGTSGDPLLVDYEGVVEYEGSSPTVFKDHSWNVKLFGLTVKDGGSENADDDTETADEAAVDDYLPFDAPGLYYVSGEITTPDGDECSGNVWVKLDGSPVGTIPWIVGVVFTALGAIMVALGWPSR